MLIANYHKGLSALLWSLFLLPLLFSCAVPQNNSDLVRLRALKDEAYAGDPESQYQLGIHYTSNDRWRWNKARGYGWFVDAAEAGHANAQYMAGMSHLLGQGVKESPSAALRWFGLAAEQGHSRSQYQLGKLYLSGSGVQKDATWGRYWLEQSALTGHPPAQFLLAAVFKKGLGGQINPSEAWGWLNRAAKNGNKDAKTALQKIDPTMTPAEKTQGRKLLQYAIKEKQGSLYLSPKIRYVQTRLRALGFFSGKEDGVNGLETKKAIQLYLQKKKLPRETSIDQLIRSLRGSD